MNIVKLDLQYLCSALAPYLSNAQLDSLLVSLSGAVEGPCIEKFLLPEFGKQWAKIGEQGLVTTGEKACSERLQGIVAAIKAGFAGDMAPLQAMLEGSASLESYLDSLELPERRWEPTLKTSQLAESRSLSMKTHFESLVSLTFYSDKELQFIAFFNFRNALLGYGEGENDISSVLFWAVCRALKETVNGLQGFYGRDEDCGTFRVGEIAYKFGGFFHWQHMEIKDSSDNEGAKFQIPDKSTGHEQFITEVAAWFCGKFGN
jgi:hypothetical protein